MQTVACAVEGNPAGAGKPLAGWALLALLAVWVANGLYLPALAARGPLAFWAADLLQWVVLPGVLAVLLARRHAIRPAQYGFGRPGKHWPELAGETAGVFITAGLAFFAFRTAAWLLLDPPPGTFSLGAAFPQTWWARGLATLYAAVTAGVVESAAFIGLSWLFYRARSPAPSRLLFTLLASALFAASHWEQGVHGVCGAFGFHLVACFWYFRLRSLWPVAAGHAWVDLVAFA